MRKANNQERILEPLAYHWGSRIRFPQSPLRLQDPSFYQDDDNKIYEDSGSLKNRKQLSPLFRAGGLVFGTTLHIIRRRDASITIAGPRYQKAGIEDAFV